MVNISHYCTHSKVNKANTSYQAFGRIQVRDNETSRSEKHHTNNTQHATIYEE